MPTVSSVTKLVQDAVRTRLADATHGFNVTLESIRASYGFEPFAIDFAKRRADATFYEVHLDPRIVAETARPVWPFATLFIEGFGGGARVVSSRFDGRLTVGLDVFLSISQSQPPTEDNRALAVNDTIIAVFNDVDTFNLWGETTNPITYGWDIQGNSRLMIGAQNWLHWLEYRIPLGVHVD